MLKTGTWKEEELKALLRLVEKERAAPFQCQRVTQAERLASLAFFEGERSRKAQGGVLRRLFGPQEFECASGDCEEEGFSGALSRAYAELRRNLAEEQRADLAFFAAIDKRGAIPEAEREAFENELESQGLKLSQAQAFLLREYCSYRSHSDALLEGLALALRSSLRKAPLSEEKRNPYSGAKAYRCQKAEGGYAVEIAPDSQGVFAPESAPEVEKHPRKM
jgi:hypothetical protein